MGEIRCTSRCKSGGGWSGGPVKNKCVCGGGGEDYIQKYGKCTSRTQKNRCTPVGVHVGVTFRSIGLGVHPEQRGRVIRSTSSCGVGYKLRRKGY